MVAKTHVTLVVLVTLLVCCTAYRKYRTYEQEPNVRHDLRDSPPEKRDKQRKWKSGRSDTNVRHDLRDSPPEKRDMHGKWKRDRSDTKPPPDVIEVGPGESCAVSNCKKGLVCLNGTCYIRIGYTCDDCVGQFCVPGATCYKRTCRTAADLHGDCTRLVCKAGLECFDNVCKKRIGATCKSNDECASNCICKAENKKCSFKEEECRTPYSVVQGRCIRPFNEPRTNSDARASCEEIGGTLYTFKDETEDRHAIYDWCWENGEEYKIWIGLDDIKEEGTFIWHADGSEMSNCHPPWAPNEPQNNNSEHCVELSSSFLLNDVDCNVKRMFICEKKYC